MAIINLGNWEIRSFTTPFAEGDVTRVQLSMTLLIPKSEKEFSVCKDTRTFTLVVMSALLLQAEKYATPTEWRDILLLYWFFTKLVHTPVTTYSEHVYNETTQLMKNTEPSAHKIRVIGSVAKSVLARKSNPLMMRVNRRDWVLGLIS